MIRFNPTFYYFKHVFSSIRPSVIWRNVNCFKAVVSCWVEALNFGTHKAQNFTSSLLNVEMSYKQRLSADGIMVGVHLQSAQCWDGIKTEAVGWWTSVKIIHTCYPILKHLLVDLFALKTNVYIYIYFLQKKFFHNLLASS